MSHGEAGCHVFTTTLHGWPPMIGCMKGIHGSHIEMEVWEQGLMMRSDSRKQKRDVEQGDT